MKISLKGWISPLVLFCMLATGVFIELIQENKYKAEQTEITSEIFAFHVPILEQDNSSIEEDSFFPSLISATK